MPRSTSTPTDRLSPPSAAHWFGTDHFGRDTFSRIVYGSRLALLIGVGVVGFALATGVPSASPRRFTPGWGGC